MKHRKGIELGEANINVEETLGSLPQWFELVAYCPACQHANLLDRYELARRLGKGFRLAGLGARMRCTACGNMIGNRPILKARPRH